MTDSNDIYDGYEIGDKCYVIKHDINGVCIPCEVVIIGLSCWTWDDDIDVPTSTPTPAPNVNASIHGIIELGITSRDPSWETHGIRTLDKIYRTIEECKMACDNLNMKR